jgi:hypothetical protein
VKLHKKVFLVHRNDAKGNEDMKVYSAHWASIYRSPRYASS